MRAQVVSFGHGPADVAASVGRMLTSDQKGAVAELAIAIAAADLGIGVWGPYTVERYDLIFDLRPGLLRVQCKWAGRHGNVISVPCYRNRRNRDGLLGQYYSPEDIDAYAAYCPEVDRCYFLPIVDFANRIAIQLRFGPTRNNQSVGINWAKDYEFAATLRPQGGRSSAGRAPVWQTGGHGFEPRRLH
jgi:PD-(D/E)XK endonuclease